MNKDTQQTPMDDELAGQYVLGTLTAQERSDFEQRLANSSALQKAVNQWQQHFLSITDHLEPVDAPQSLSARIERSVDELEKSVKPEGYSSSDSNPSFWESLLLWRGMSMACLVLALIFGLKLQTAQPIMGEPTYIAVLVQPENKTPGWVIQTSQANKIQLVPLGAVEIPEGKALQFWTKADDWDAPISLGLVKSGETLNLDVNNLPPFSEDQLFELTLELETGSPTGKPTGPITSIGRGVSI